MKSRLIGLVCCCLLSSAAAALGGPATTAADKPTIAAADKPATTAARKPVVKPAPKDDLLVQAKRFVERSDRYLHQDRLRRGMKGYGLTIFAGTKVARFDAEIISVVKNWGPQQDVILVKLAGHGLEKSGIIAGMSGSPIYMKDPRDGTFKIIGAIAYGWSFQNEPLCGIQPITQMLAVGATFRKLQGAETRPASAKRPVDKPTITAADRPTKPAGGSARGKAPREYLAVVLNPRKIDFTSLVLPKRRALPASERAADGPHLVPLATPLMVSGASRRSMADLRKLLRPMGLTPVQSGGAGSADAKAAANARLETGGGISVGIVRGDADWYAVGTVTDRVGDWVLALGHSFDAVGDLDLPIGPAYIHTIVSNQQSSFKLSSSLGITGALERDEYAGVTGRVGKKAPMIPMTVTVDWKKDGRKQTFRYELCRHRVYTAVLPRFLLMESAWALRELPERHTVRYAVDVDFGTFGTFHSENISTGSDIFAAASDVSRPLAAMVSNPFAPERYPEKIHAEIIIEDGQINASILGLQLDADVYRPGDTVTGKLTIRPTRQPRQTVLVSFDLPADLPERTYSLQVCNATAAMGSYQNEMPHLFDPQDDKELFAAVKRVVTGRANQLYLRLPLGRGGIALGPKELPDLPDSRARILREARLPDTTTFTRAIVRTMPAKYVMFGSTSASFRVEKRPKPTLLRSRD